MADPAHDNVVKEPPLPQSTNQDQNLSHSLKRLSIVAGSTKTSPSAPSSPSKTFGQRNNSLPPSPNGHQPRSPLHRSPSSMSLNSRSATPTLHKKASMNSLHGVGGVVPSRSSPSRRSSSAQYTNASMMVGKSPLSEIEDETPPPPRYTAASIASNHFKVDLETHDKEKEPRDADTIVILHDSCYGHRYSRPRTSKAALSTIVERPERIHASILGLSVAYVRLGERHAEGQHAPHPHNDPSTIPTVPFRIRKTSRRIALSSQAVTNVHGVKWMEELKIMCDNAESRLAMNGKELTRPEMNRSPDQDAPTKFHEGDLYLCAESLNAMEGALGAVCEGVDAVFQGSATGKGPHRTFVAIRPPGHHCSASYPSGFCWLNNVHVGISHAALTHGLTHAAIIDFDLHHGDGSQAIAWESNKRAASAAKNSLPWKKTSIGYFSLHDINSYPCEMGDEEKVKNASLCIENAHGQSIWNVHLQPWKSEKEFWDLYETKYSILLEKTRNYLKSQTERLRLNPNGPKPKGAIFLSAGFDASEWESSGMQRHKVNVPTEFYARLTRDVVKLAAEEGTGADGRIISVLEGGYSDRALCTGVLSHLSGMSAGDPITIKKELSPNGLAYEMGQKIGTFNGTAARETITLGTQSYDPEWWSVQRLEQLDALIHPPPPAEAKKPRDIVTPTYSSPTQSFINKVTISSPRRTVSGLANMSNGSPRTVSRPPSPPPPEVDWTVAAHELSKLLIPTDRQTMSCRPEELSAEATRARRDRQSILTPPAPVVESAETSGQRMALRTRKAVKPLVESPEGDEAKKPASKAGRRKTVAGTAVLASDKKSEPSYAKPTTTSNRRLSMISNSSIGTEASRATTQRAVSNGAPAVQRPGSAQSVRPDSSMSSRGHYVAPVVVKKTRAPAQPRGEAPKTSRVRKKSPLNTSVPTGREGTMEPPSRAGSVAPPASTSQNSDMDALTSGMKKIKINLTTKAQREAREAAKKASESTSAKPMPVKAAKPRTEPKPILPAPKAPQQEPVVMNTATEPQLPRPATPTQSLPPHIPNHLQQAAEVPLPASSPAGPPQAHISGTAFGQPAFQFPPHPSQPSQLTPTTSVTPNNDIFIPYQPEGPTPTSLSTENQEPLRWLPPNTTNTPSPMKRHDLPVFTATSTIPFAVNPGGNMRPSVQGMMSNGRSEGSGENQNGGINGIKKEMENTEGKSIWDIPDTPASKK